MANQMGGYIGTPQKFDQRWEAPDGKVFASETELVDYLISTGMMSPGLGNVINNPLPPPTNIPTNTYGQTAPAAGTNWDSIYPIGGNAPAPAAGAPPVNPQDAALNEADLQGQYLNFFDIPAFGASPYQRWLLQQMAPTVAGYVMGSRNNPDQTFASYLGGTGVMGARSGLAGSYNDLVSNPDKGRADWVRQTLGDSGWNQLLKTVASSKYGRFFGPQFAQAIPQYQSRYEATPEGFQAPGESGFLGYLRQKYGF